MGKNKCSICNQEFDNLDDLIVHEALHDVPPEDEYSVDYFDGKSNVRATLEICDATIDVTPLDAEEPTFSIPYKRIVAINSMSNEQVNSFFAIGNDAKMLALTLGTAFLVDHFANKPQLFLVLTFTDEYDLQHSAAFHMQKHDLEYAQQDIYDKVVQVKGKAKSL
ncbi:MAG: hypothetical protein ACFCUE_10765 [Candidatus Bathyarchaeia archaeon]|jgi:hypothetical protein